MFLKVYIYNCTMLHFIVSTNVVRLWRKHRMKSVFLIESTSHNRYIVGPIFL